MSKGLLITGATGKQGAAVVDAILASPADSSDFTILAVTRSPDSASAQALSKRDNVKIVKGDLNDTPALFDTAKAMHANIWGVFSVQVPRGQGATPITEEAQGKALVDEAIKRDVKQFVYTSADRGGDSSIDRPTHVPHFISKYNIEKHLIDKVKGTDMRYTILRPVAFMDNFAPDMMSKAWGATVKVGLPADKPLQLIALADIGHFAAEAFRKPHLYRNRSMSLAGDNLTFNQLDQTFKDKTGQPCPRTFDFVGSGVLWGVKEMRTMFEFFRDTGFGADIPSLKAEHPGLLSLSGWIEKNSAFAKKS